MQRKIIALDMDGTLLPKSKKIPFLTKLYLRKLTRLGHLVVLASGRPSRALKVFHEQIHSNAPVVCYNGAFTFHPSDPNFKPYAKNIPHQVMLDIYTHANEAGMIMNVMFETDDEIWFLHEDAYLANFFWLQGMAITYGDVTKTLSKDTMTAIFRVVRGEKEDALLKALVAQHPGLKMRFWGGSPYAEFYMEGTSKADGIEQICRYYGLNIKDVIAFGDGHNDLEMLLEAGIGVVMKNAHEEIKGVTPYESVDTSEKEGVRKTLKKLLRDL